MVLPVWMQSMISCARRVVFAQVVRIVGGDQRDSGLARELVDGRHDALVLRPVRGPGSRGRNCSVPKMSAYSYARRRASSYLSAMRVSLMSPRRQADMAMSPLECCAQQVLVDARLVVEAVEVAGGDQLDQVAVAFLVFAEQDEVVVAVRVAPVLMALLRDIDFAADDRVDSSRVGGVVELDRAEQVAVVGHGDGGHLLFCHRLHQAADFAGAVEQRVIGMAMQVDERGVGHGLTYRGEGAPPLYRLSAGSRGITRVFSFLDKSGGPVTRCPGAIGSDIRMELGGKLRLIVGLT